MATAEFAHGPRALIDVISLINLRGHNLKVGRTKITLPVAAEIFSPILFTVYLQLLAFYLAVQKGINVDRPRNIKKFIS
jgi:glucosamine 6-phosphate synthetase-like amidotransferase/phosphosugar isomerase protein